ncbi:hypothetical protein V1517DRAFT_310781 [Lipomyces orientalis]|uniref:Uncharacterized protein n=1 Tax=Lipomyces orientalis TaxID=1233043 RepID=A0ACC3TE44_9ASCO
MSDENLYEEEALRRRVHDMNDDAGESLNPITSLLGDLPVINEIWYGIVPGILIIRAEIENLCQRESELLLVDALQPDDANKCFWTCVGPRRVRNQSKKLDYQLSPDDLGVCHVLLTSACAKQHSECNFTRFSNRCQYCAPYLAFSVVGWYTNDCYLFDTTSGMTHKTRLTGLFSHQIKRRMVKNSYGFVTPINTCRILSAVDHILLSHLGREEHMYLGCR